MAQQENATAEESTGNHQRIAHRMLNTKVGNTEVRGGKCYIIYRSELDPRWPEPQIIDESVIERNRLDSLNFQRLNPDVETRTRVKCICSRVLHLADDWYVQTHEGTILCQSCVRCFRCRILCFTAARKFNSIDGIILCNTCMLSYGRYKKPNFRIRIQPMPRSLSVMQTAMDGNTPNSEDDKTNSNVSNNVDSGGGGGGGSRTLSEPRHRHEGRPPLRLVYYSDPRPPNHNRPDYKMEPPPYMAVDRNAGSQACPECGKQALSQALVVPSSAKVYHEKSFSCAKCKLQMHMGYQLPMVQFQTCSCIKQPKVWCTGYYCRLDRIAHHLQNNCQLEPIHPGGRPLREVPGLRKRFNPDTDNLLKRRHGVENQP